MEKNPGFEMNCGEGVGVEVDRVGDLAELDQQQRGQVGGDHPDREADEEGERRAPGERAVAVDERHADPRDRPEVRPDDHRPDDQDRLVEVDADRGDQHRQHREGQEALRELDVLGGARGDVLPDHRVGADVVAAVMVGDLRREPGDLRVDLVDRDRALAVDVELAQVRDEQADVAPRDVASIRSPSGLVATPRRWTMLKTVSVSSSSSSVCSQVSGGAMIRRCTTGSMVRIRVEP